MKQAEFVAFVQNVIMNFVVDIFAECSFRHRAPGKLRHCIKTKFNVKNLYIVIFCSYATGFVCFIKFWSNNHVPWRIWHLFLGYRGISIIRCKNVAISNIIEGKMTDRNMIGWDATDFLSSWVVVLVLRRVENCDYK